MIKNLDFLGKPSREKINLFVGLGISLFVLGMIDLFQDLFAHLFNSFKYIIYFTLDKWKFVPIYIISPKNYISIV